MSKPLPFSLRTADGERRYQEAQQKGETIPLDREPHIAEFTYWFAIANAYPYDAVYEKHDMLLPRRKIQHRNQLNADELAELKTIITYFIDPNYDQFFENMTRRKSVLNHYHTHMGVFWKERKDD